MGKRILVVDDDKKTVDIIRLYLEKSNFQPLIAYDGVVALEMVQNHQPDLVVLDIMLPKMDGLDLCHRIRSESDIPIIMLTARSTIEDKLIGLELGADDYIAKPFSPRELVARIQVVLRRLSRTVETPVDTFQHQHLSVDFVRHEVHLGDDEIHLTLKEFKLLETLVRQPGRAFTRVELLHHIFGYDYSGLERTIDVHVKNLRKKIEPNPAKPTFVQTVFGVGYKFAEER